MNSFGKWTFHLFALLSLLVSSIGLAAKDFTEVETIEKSMATMACLKKNSYADQIWSGFYFTGPTLLHFKNGHTYGFAIQGKDPRWQKMAFGGETYFYSPSDFLGLSSIPLSFSFPIEGRQSYVVQLDSLRPSGEWSLVVLTHERFHLFQFENFKNLKLDSYSQHLNVQNQALIQLENRALYDYLLQRKVEFLLTFLAINHERSLVLDAASREWEDFQQRMEGMAEYIQTKTFMICSEVSEGFDSVELLKKRSMEKLVQNENSVLNSIKWRHYQVGAILGLALDDLRSPLWKSRVQIDENPQSILAKHFNLNDQDRARYFNSAKTLYDYDSILKSSAEGVEKYRLRIQEKFDEYHRSSGREVQISFQKSLNCHSGGTSKDSLYLSDGSIFEVAHTGYIQCERGKVVFDSIDFQIHGKSGFYFKVSDDTVVRIDGHPYTIRELSALKEVLSFSSLGFDSQTANVLFQGIRGSIKPSKDRFRIQVEDPNN